jgi:mono/diheme cytochrome c family protein
MKQFWLGSLCAAVLLLASYAQAPVAHAQTPETQSGKAAFDARCSRCHQVSRLQGYMAKRPDDATRAADLDAFLTRHHASEASDRKSIIAWLLTQQATPAP